MKLFDEMSRCQLLNWVGRSAGQLVSN